MQCHPPILYDSGATALMTNSLEGLIGKLHSVSGEDFTTAMGVKSLTKKAYMSKHVFGKNGMSAPLTDYFWYDPTLPFDIYGSPMLRANWGSTYVDSDHPTNWTVGPHLKLKFAGDIILELGRTANGLEWLSYDAPRAIMQCWQGDEALIDSMLSGAMFPLLSSGAGMGKIGKALTDVEAAVLDHSLRGHPSLQRMVVSSKTTTVNGLKLTAEGVRQLAILGCDHCNALKIKLVQPKENVQPGDVPEGQAIRIILYDSFGVVPWPSAQYGFQHAHMYGSKSKKVYWLKGSKTLDEKVVVDLHTLIANCLRTFFWRSRQRRSQPRWSRRRGSR